MSNSDTPTSPLFALKGEARQLAAYARAQGNPMTHSDALEQVASKRGFRDWNALSSHVASGSVVPLPRALLPAFPPPWADMLLPFPQLPLRVVKPSELRRHSSIVEVMRWARQLHLIATKVPEGARREMLELIGERVPYVLERDRGRWPDGMFHLCDRGYDEFKGFVLTHEQVEALGMRQWNEAYGSHDGNLAFTVIGDDHRYPRKANTALVMANLLAWMAMEADKLLGQSIPDVSEPADAW